MLLIIQLTPGCMSDQYVRVNDNSNETMMTMPDLMMNVRTCVTATTTYTISYLS
jgi:hypothetical protein